MSVRGSVKLSYQGIADLISGQDNIWSRQVISDTESDCYYQLFRIGVISNVGHLLRNW
jgi:hypothetical protein